MVATYEAFSGKTFDEGRFLQLLREKKAQSSEESAQEKGGLSVGIAGARANKNIKKILEERACGWPLT